MGWTWPKKWQFQQSSSGDNNDNDINEHDDSDDNEYDRILMRYLYGWKELKIVQLPSHFLGQMVENWLRTNIFCAGVENGWKRVVWWLCINIYKYIYIWDDNHKTWCSDTYFGEIKYI